jgi:hypothetical protein
MSPTRLHKTILATTIVVCAIGVLDALIGDEPDLAAVFSLILVLQVVLLGRLQTRRPAVPLRADLVAWLRTRAASNGEPMEALADRSVVAYRARLDRG